MSDRRVLVPMCKHYGEEPFALERGRCDFCGAQEVLVLAVDNSSGEYGPGRICEGCCAEAFKVAK